MTSLGTEATGVPAARLAQIEQVIEDELGDLERQDIAVQMWQQMDEGAIADRLSLIHI